VKDLLLNTRKKSTNIKSTLHCILTVLEMKVGIYWSEPNSRIYFI